MMCKVDALATLKHFLFISSEGLFVMIATQERRAEKAVGCLCSMYISLL